MKKEEIKNVYEKLEKMLKELEEHSDADACPTFVPAPPELTNNTNMDGDITWNSLLF